MKRHLLQLGLAATTALIFAPAASAAHHKHGGSVSPPAGGCTAEAVPPTVVPGHHRKLEAVGHRGKGGEGTEPPPATTPCPPTGVVSSDGSFGDGSGSLGGGAIVGIDNVQPGGGNGFGGDGLLDGLGGGGGNGLGGADNFRLNDIGGNGDYLGPTSASVAAAPEPGTLALLGLAFGAFRLSRRARQRQQ